MCVPIILFGSRVEYVCWAAFLGSLPVSRRFVRFMGNWSVFKYVFQLLFFFFCWRDGVLAGCRRFDLVPSLKLRTIIEAYVSEEP